ncbi:MAG: hypothetical protein VCD00_08050, partial [Candidatus Hydrogenedentota bacterium]
VVTAEVVVADEPVDDFVDTDDDDEGATMAMAEEEGSKVAKKKVKAPAEEVSEEAPAEEATEEAAPEAPAEDAEETPAE